MNVGLDICKLCGFFWCNLMIMWEEFISVLRGLFFNAKTKVIIVCLFLTFTYIGEM
jgi:hypothetical protein